MRMGNRSQVGIVTASKSSGPARRRKRHFLISEAHSQAFDAQRTAWDTEELLSTRGWCLWRCESLASDVIAIVRDDNMPDIPGSYVTYTETELRCLFNESRSVDCRTLRLIHEAKRCGMLQARHLKDAFVAESKDSASASGNCHFNLAMAMS